MKPLYDGQEYNQPLGGISFEGSGAYGSAFDDMRGNFVVNICDECIESKAKTGHIIVAVTERPVTPKVTYHAFPPKGFSVTL